MNDSIRMLSIEKEKQSSWGRLVHSRIEATVKNAGVRILDAGCTGGGYVKYFCEHGYDTYGFDLFPDKKWQGKYKSRFQLADIRHIPFKDNSFDTIVSFEVLEHLEDFELALSELHRVTRKNIVISVPNCSIPEVFQKSGLAFHYWVDPTHKQMFTEEVIKKKLTENGFSIQSVEHINPVFPEILFLSG